MKLFILLLTIFIFPLSLYCQIETDSTRARSFDANPRYSTWSFGMGTVKLKNTYLGPLHNNGFGVKLFDHSNERYTAWGTTDYNFSTGVTIFNFDTDSDAANDATGININFNFQKYWHKLLKPQNSSRFNFYAGVGIASDMALDGNTSPYGYNANSIRFNVYTRLSVAVKYRFKIKNQHFDFHQQIATPLIGIAILPRYGAMYYGAMGNIDEAKFGVLFTAPHNMWGVYSTTYLDWRRRKHGKEKNYFYRFGLKYNAQRINYETKHQLGETYFTLGVVRKL